MLTGQEDDAYDDGESISSEYENIKRKKKIKSGITAKPSDSVKSVQVWPHFNLHLGYTVSTNNL